MTKPKKETEKARKAREYREKLKSIGFKRVPGGGREHSS